MKFKCLPGYLWARGVKGEEDKQKDRGDKREEGKRKEQRWETSMSNRRIEEKEKEKESQNGKKIQDGDNKEMK